MDRVITYAGEIPLVEDQLAPQRNAMVAIGRLAQAAFGTQVAAEGFAPSVTGSDLNVTLGPGSILVPGVVDSSAYSVLPVVGSELIQQYISRDPVVLPVPAADVATTVTIYATVSTEDTGSYALPFYNAANPSQPFAGQGNSGVGLPTARQNIVTFGAAITVPTGAYPLWSVSVGASATSIAATDITQAPNAPFWTPIPGLQGAIGFTPVQQGGGPSQVSTKLNIGQSTVNTQRLRFAADGVDGGELALYSDVTAETSRAQGAEGTITTNLNAEVTRAVGAEGALQTQITTETNRAQSAELTITGSVTAETTRAEGAESSLASSISAETARAKAAEATNASNLNAEIVRATSVENTLQTQLTAETTRATGAEAAIQTWATGQFAKKIGIFNFSNSASNATTVTATLNFTPTGSGTAVLNFNGASSNPTQVLISNMVLGGTGYSATGGAVNYGNSSLGVGSFTLSVTAGTPVSLGITMAIAASAQTLNLGGTLVVYYA